MKKELGYGVALVGALAGAGALTAAMIRKKKREEIYHEAELKAMNELDEMMSENGDDALDCDTCSCAEACAAAAEQAEVDEPEEQPADETEEEPSAE
ncbi:MAG: hypothetical protein ACLUB2_01810 [Butyricicoccus pullicaecorum]|nr:hypothetical protein [Butyricicoccus pullicaecorum]